MLRPMPSVSLPQHVHSLLSPHARLAWHPRPVCAECQHAMAPLYEMNDQCYCAACLHAWCLSLPEVQADLLVQTQREQEG